MRGVKTKIANHDKMRFLNMLRETQEEVCCRKDFPKGDGWHYQRHRYVHRSGRLHSGRHRNQSGKYQYGAPQITCDIFHEFLKVVVAPEIIWSGLSADNEAIRIF